MKTLITNTLIAGILIQASRFLMAVAIDISTIATYGIGGLPISVLGNERNKDLVDITVLGTEIYVNTSDSNSEHPIITIKTTSPTSGGTQEFISPCETMTFTSTTS
jgi:hypothetical protein